MVRQRRKLINMFGGTYFEAEFGSTSTEVPVVSWLIASRIHVLQDHRKIGIEKNAFGGLIAIWHMIVVDDNINW